MTDRGHAMGDIDLAEVLANWRGQAAVLRARGHGLQGTAIEELCDDVARTAESFLNWLSEDEAVLRSGRSRAWLRARFAELESDGNAKHDGRRRLYRECVIPKRANLDRARDEARRIAHGVA